MLILRTKNLSVICPHGQKKTKEKQMILNETKERTNPKKAPNHKGAGLAPTEEGQKGEEKPKKELIWCFLIMNLYVARFVALHFVRKWVFVRGLSGFLFLSVNRPFENIDGRLPLIFCVMNVCLQRRFYFAMPQTFLNVFDGCAIFN